MSLGELKVRFACPHCNTRLICPARRRGKQGKCPRCSKPLEVPAQSQAPPEVKPVVTPAPQQQATVPLNVTLPHNLGGIQTTVSQPTANSIAKTVIGGFLVALGVIIGIIFGKGRPTA